MTDNAFSQGLITTKEVGISFEPSNQTTATNGELTFGGIDDSKFVGDITFVYVPLLAYAVSLSNSSMEQPNYVDSAIKRVRWH